MAMLEVKNIGISFGGLKAVDNFSLTIEKGQLYGLIGPNGAGKSTTKKKLLYDADVELVILRYYIRIAYDQEYISGHTYGVAAKKLTEIGKMLGGFIKSVQS